MGKKTIKPIEPATSPGTDEGSTLGKKNKLDLKEKPPASKDTVFCENSQSKQNKIEINETISSKELKPSESSSFINRLLQGIKTFIKDLSDKESIKYLIIAITVIAVSIGIAMALGQASYNLGLESNASNAGHLYGIVTSAIAFFFFARYLRHKKDIFYVRRFLVFYFIIYFAIVLLILAFLQNNIVYILSTLGNSFILFSAYTLIIFILSPEILGVLGATGGVKKLFLSGQHVRLIVVYLFIAIMQIFGFSLLDYAIQINSGGNAYTGVPGGGCGTWFDFFYFSTITFVTIGYGDIHPALPIAELSSTIQAVLSHVISILFLAVLLLYLSSNSSINSSQPSQEVK